MSRLIKHSNWPHSIKAKKAAVLVVGLMIGAGLFWFYHQHRAQAIFLTVTSTTAIVPNGDVTTGWTVAGGTSDGTCGAGGGTTHHCDRIDEVSSTSSPNPSTTDYVSTGTSGTTGEVEQYNMGTLTIPTGGWVSNINLYMDAESAACNGNGTNCDTVDMNIVVGGTAQTASTKTMTGGAYGWFNTSFNAPAGGWSQSQLDGFQAKFTRTRVGGGNAGSADDDVRIAAVYAVITYQYYATSMLNQIGYTFENDDGANVNSDSVQAGSSFASGQTITNVQKGERLTLRVQLKNTGTGPTNYANLGLFYDRGDGIWTRVRRATTPITATGNCSTNTWSCYIADDLSTTDNISEDISTTIDPLGNPWVSYDTQNGAVRISHYVGSGGSGCGATGSTAWSCQTIDDPTSAGQCTFLNETCISTTSAGWSPSGDLWVVYGEWAEDSFLNYINQQLWVAKYVGSGGTGCTNSTYSGAWTCTQLDTTTTLTGPDQIKANLAFDSSGNPWVSYYSPNGEDLKVANYVGSGGNCTSTAWTCTTVDSTNNVGGDPSITFDASGNAWISYYDFTNSGLRAAHYVGSGGTGCAVTSWTCVAVDTTNTVGQYTSIATDPSGAAWVSYYDATNHTLRLARYVSNGGSGCASAAWTCTSVDSANTNGVYTSIAFDAAGNAWVSYYGSGNSLRLARYVGSGGSGCSSTAWTCGGVDSISSTPQISYTAITFDANGRPWVAYPDSTNSHDLRVATINRSGEIIMSPGRAGNNGDTITSSHADMTSASDSTNKSDADCIGGGTWNNGKWSTGSEVNVSVPAGDTTAQCTEIAFTIDTSQALDGTTYRFIVASNDSWRKDKGVWRGPISISSYPQLTIAAGSTFRSAKDILPIMSACTDVNWGCNSISAAGSSNTSIAFGSSGIPWISYYDAGFYVAHYVGSGGTGCTSTTAWTCDNLMTNPDDPGQYSSIAIGSTGYPWVSFVDPTSGQMYVANYVGSGGSGCASSAWSCVAVDTTAIYTSIAVDSAGNPWVSYFNTNNSTLRVAHYVGSGGTGCTNSAWTCMNADAQATGAVGQYSSIAIDSSGNPWVSYYDLTNSDLKVARYVGSGGTGCGTVTAWACTTVDSNAGQIGQLTSIAIDSSGNPWVSYYFVDSGITRVAHYVGSGGTGCAVSSWTCTSVDTTSYSQGTAIALDSTGAPWIAYDGCSTNLCSGPAPTGHVILRAAKYVGGGTGTGCVSGSSDWTCTTVLDSTTDVTNFPSLAFDFSGTPWISYYNGTSNLLEAAKMNMPPNQLTATAIYNVPGRNAPRSDGRWHLDNGYAPRATSGSCTATVDALGYCGIGANDNTFDSISGTNARLIYNFAYQNNNPSSIPTVTWYGRSNVAPSTAGTTGDIVLQAYNFSTKTWDTLATNSSSSDCNTADCSFSLQANKAGEQRYYENISNNFWIYFRIWQYENSSSETFKTDYFNVTFENTGSRLNLGKRFLNGVRGSYEL